MPTISNLSFSVRFNLTGTPTLVLTDTTSSPPAGLVGIFAITQPDGYTRTGNINSPDITSAGGSFSFPLTLDSSGEVQRGTYTIVYTGNAPGYLSTNFTRAFQFQYIPVSLNLRKEFNVFTPDLKYYDDTVYSVSNYSNSAVTRAWSAVSIPTGTITGSTATLNLIFGGQYYDANYTISLTSSLLYTHTTYNWLTVQETISKTFNTYAQTPPGSAVLVGWINDLSIQVQNLVNTFQPYEQAKADLEYSQTLLSHLVDQAATNNMVEIDSNLAELLRVLNKYQTYTPTNLPITAYNWNQLLPSTVWGNISGAISNQTDLWTIIQDLYKRDNYVHNQSSASSSWTVVHNMGKFPSVSVVDTANDEVEASVTYNSNNQLTITFSAPVAGKAYIN